MTQDEVKTGMDNFKAEKESELKKDVLEFDNAMYEGELPKNIMELFKKAIFQIAPMVDDLPVWLLEKWLEADISKLPFSAIEKITRVIAVVNRKDLFTSLEQAIKQLKPIEAVSKDMMEKRAAFNFSLDARKEKLKEELYNLQIKLQNQPGKRKVEKLSKSKPKRLAAV